ADLRPSTEGNFAGADSGAAVQGIAPVQRRDPAATRAAAEDAAQCRGARARARPRSRSLGYRQAVSRALDARPDRLARHRAAPARRGPVSCDRAAAAAEADLPAAQQSASRIGDGDPGIRRDAARAQSLAGADRAAGRGGGGDPDLARLVAAAVCGRLAAHCIRTRKGGAARAVRGAYLAGALPPAGAAAPAAT